MLHFIFFVLCGAVTVTPCLNDPIRTDLRLGDQSHVYILGEHNGEDALEKRCVVKRYFITKAS